MKTTFQSLGVSRHCHWKIHGFCLHCKLSNKLQRFIDGSTKTVNCAVHPLSLRDFDLSLLFTCQFYSITLTHMRYFLSQVIAWIRHWVIEFYIMHCGELSRLPWTLHWVIPGCSMNTTLSYRTLYYATRWVIQVLL